MEIHLAKEGDERVTERWKRIAMLCMKMSKRKKKLLQKIKA